MNSSLRWHPESELAGGLKQKNATIMTVLHTLKYIRTCTCTTASQDHESASSEDNPSKGISTPKKIMYSTLKLGSVLVF